MAFQERTPADQMAEQVMAALQILLNYTGGWDSPADHPCGIARDTLAKAKAFGWTPDKQMIETSGG